MSAIIEAAKRFAQLDGDICSLLVGVDGRVSCQSCDLRKQTLWHESDADLLEEINSLLPADQRVAEEAETSELKRWRDNYELAADCLADMAKALESELANERASNGQLLSEEKELTRTYKERWETACKSLQEACDELQGQRDAVAELRQQPAAKDDLASALEDAPGDEFTYFKHLRSWSVYEYTTGGDKDTKELFGGSSIHTAAQAIRAHLSRVTTEQAQAAVAAGDWGTVDRYRKQEEK